MPLHEGQPDAVARLYAASLFEVAEAKGGQTNIENLGAQLGDIVELARADARFAEFLSSKILAVKDRRASIKKMFEGKADPIIVNLMLVLNDKERLGHLGVIARAYDEIVQARFGRVEVDVITVHPVDDDQMESLKNKLQAKLGKEPVLHRYHDPSMIGGLKLRVGDQLYDASVQTRLRRLRERLSTQGAAAMKAQIGRLIEDNS
ncbi:MAG: ATP synthase F1 subunit delta [Phycisphaeraceae bacterium]|nr:ATP synthase F1 subunit delta [Phycisphaeraceae bacterium]